MDERLNLRLGEFEHALEDFSKALSIQPELFPELVADTLKSGWIQKFEFTTELMWKTLKDYCFIKLGLDEMSPKRAVKRFFESGACDYTLYETLLGSWTCATRSATCTRKRYSKKQLPACWKRERPIPGSSIS
jgi:hypothetical protein